MKRASIIFLFMVFSLSVSGYGAAVETVKQQALIAIFPLEDLRPSEETRGLGEDMAASLTDGLSAMKDVQVVERRDLKKIMEEIGLGLSGAIDQETAIKVGKLLGANHLLIGSFMKFRDKVTINARLVRTETGEITTTSRVKGSFSDLFDLEEELARNLLSRGLSK
ncbi:MAG: hypothetical protein JW884_13235 [Deltaproteobacteria bacterium]|nr:hypothetical protein [Deltaproteobacteria bacterium]